MNNEFYLANCSYLYSPEISLANSDVLLWSEIYNLLPSNVSMVDRRSHIQLPYNFKLYEPFRMPTDVENFSMTYEQCAEEKTIELINLAKTLNKKITIFYSGGIDSTFILVSFLKYVSKQDLNDYVQVALSLESIHENTNFYYNYVRKFFKLVPSENMGNMFDTSTIICGGEHNDQLFGSDIIGGMNADGMIDEVHKPYSKDFVKKFFIEKKKFSEFGANFWVELFDDHIKQKCPVDISSNFLFFWWVNFNFKWQSVYFRMLARSNPNQRQYINDDYLKNYFHHFYSSENFQRWSMCNPELKIQKTWNSYKWETKRLIYEFNKDEKYRDNKLKVPSLFNLFLAKRPAAAITTSYDFLDQDDLLFGYKKFRVKENSFVLSNANELNAQTIPR